MDDSTSDQSGSGNSNAERSDFIRATTLIEEHADSAAIHILLEQSQDDVLHNLYTSVTYGSAADLASIPVSLDEARSGSLIAIRQRVSIQLAKQFVAAAATGWARIDAFEIECSTEEMVEGFRPVDRWHRILGAGAMHGASCWCRERIGASKTLGGVELSNESVYDITESLSILEQGRWHGIPLRWFPEKLGDVDEVWPSPVLLTYGRDPETSGIVVQLELDRLNLEPSRLSVSGTAYTKGMISRTISEVGTFPMALAPADCFDLRLFVDGVVVDQKSGCIINSVVPTIVVGSPMVLQVPEHKSRPVMNVAVGASRASTFTVGRPVVKSHRAGAWEIGRAFRDDRTSDDAERFYDITADQSAAKTAFEDLGNLGKAQRGGPLTVVDPFALDSQALIAIIAAALPHRTPSKLIVYTEFKREQRSEESSVSDESSGPAQQTARERSRTEFINVAQQVFQATKVPIEVYEAERLHDRFILLADRVWHVGPSFNMLGQEVAAIVEIRDVRRKVQLRAYLNRLPSTCVWKTE